MMILIMIRMINGADESEKDCVTISNQLITEAKENGRKRTT